MVNDTPVVLDLAKDLLVAAPEGNAGASLSVPNLPTGSSVSDAGYRRRRGDPVVGPLAIQTPRCCLPGSPLMARQTRSPRPRSRRPINAQTVSVFPRRTPARCMCRIRPRGASSSSTTRIADRFDQGRGPSKGLDLSLQVATCWINQPDGNNAIVVDPTGTDQPVTS